MSRKSQKQLQPPPETTTPEILPLSGQRQNGESDRAVIACNDWLRMGIGRSFPDLLQHYTDTRGSAQPTLSYDTLRRWSSDFNWASRAVEFDATWEARKNDEATAILAYGLAHPHERVRKLYRLAAMLEAQIYERGLSGILHNIWLPDVKSIGSGEFAERVDIERFNSPLLEQYRKVLEDIAKETGGRVQKQEITGANGSPFTFEIKTIEYRAAIPPPLEGGSIPDSDTPGEGESVSDGTALG